ncbi:ATP-dependent DNA helicase RecG [Terracoccus luteus]|uniref:Probable DNA 3'-5' helicase RecG n=1 Tax=Terracoccus luteus TaxID=53356 RepID=A0A839PTD2_9MICO|nr:ATP-dependent DNA helicase RecG [Terracoccus luteus]MBB2985285.1 ATP-dependent DNA helicase RecG [Terracoccus luteus]MCP2170937.1 ATP-dependent DNA helicase RecG [Terracoccus luteus]
MPVTVLTEDSPLTKLVRKGEAEALAKAKGIHSVADLFELVPRRYVRPGQLSDLGSLQVGEDVLVVAEVATAATRPMRGRRGTMLTVVLADEAGGELDLTFFRSFGHDRKLLPGRRGFFVGTVGAYGRRLQLTHPEYELFDDDDAGEAALEWYRTHRVPVYSATGKLNSLRMRKLLHTALDSVDRVREPVPEPVRSARGLVDRAQALELVHRPGVDDDPDRGVHRLKYDEAFVLQTILAQRRRVAESEQATPRVPRPGGLLSAFDERLPFELTDGQKEVGTVLAQELARDRPMHRLLQGEVGSGKTVVALRAMLAAVDAGGQAALLAPTEVLAAQHHRSITAMLGDLAEGGRLGGAEHGTTVTLLTGSQATATRRRSLLAAASGEAGIVVGTHALIQKHVQFADLALVVVDEQHRFGVEQRDALREKAQRPPHVLVMTATPIPRTVAMTVFGDMETSTLRELPRGRSPIATHVVDAGRPGWLDRTWQRVAEEVAAGHQAYVVCPRIGELDDEPADGLRDPEDVAGTEDPDAVHEADGADGADGPGEGDERELTGVYAQLHELQANPALAGLRLAVLHGRLDPDEKEATMRAFTAGDVDVLVATTVIEVGVDVPNASVMVVVDADRFGISQLHQLRGRVGRGAVPGLCLLVTHDPGERAAERLEQVAATTDGFELARADLLLRREGDVLGARQSGRGNSIRHLRLGRRDDEQVIADAREDAFAVVAADPDLREHSALAAAVAMRLDDEQAAWLERG